MNKLLNILGLAMRAGKVIAGEDQVLRAIKSGKAKFILLSQDAGRNTKKRITDKCNTYQVPMDQYGTREELGSAIGKPERVVIAITDAGFTREIQKLIQS